MQYIFKVRHCYLVYVILYYKRRKEYGYHFNVFIQEVESDQVLYCFSTAS